MLLAREKEAEAHRQRLLHEVSGGQEPPETQGIQPLKPLDHTLDVSGGLHPALPTTAIHSRPLQGANAAPQATQLTAGT